MTVWEALRWHSRNCSIYDLLGKVVGAYIPGHRKDIATLGFNFSLDAFEAFSIDATLMPQYFGYGMSTW
jgi:hypothetical protein